MIKTQETVNQRINLLIDYFEAGNKSAFGRRVDMKSGVVGDLVGGRLNKPSFEAILKILSAYPSVNTDWLLLGEEPMLKGSHELAILLTEQQLEDVVQGLVAAHAIQRNTSQLTSSLARSLADMQVMLRRMEDENQRLAEQIMQAMLSPKEFDERERRFFADLQDDHNYNAGRIADMKGEIIPLQHAIDQLSKAKALTLYRIEGEPDASKPFGGLLAYRLNTTKSIAKQLVDSGKIPAFDTMQMRSVTEQAVREFLGEA